MTAEMQEIIQENGYLYCREIPGRGLCGLKRFMFTSAIVYGLDADGYTGRWCYELAEAKAAFLEWDGIGDPPGDWIKHKGQSGEYKNPEL